MEKLPTYREEEVLKLKSQQKRTAALKAILILEIIKKYNEKNQ